MYTTQGDYIERFMIMPPPDYPTIDNVLMVQPSDKKCWWSIHREKSAGEITANQKTNKHCYEPGLETVEMVYKTPPPPFLPVKDQKFPYTAPLPPGMVRYNKLKNKWESKCIDINPQSTWQTWQAAPCDSMNSSISLEKIKDTDKFTIKHDQTDKCISFDQNLGLPSKCDNTKTKQQFHYKGDKIIHSASGDCVEYTRDTNKWINKGTCADDNKRQDWLYQLVTIAIPTLAPAAPAAQPAAPAAPAAQPAAQPAAPPPPPPPNACLEKKGIYCIKCNSGYKPFNDTCVTNDTEVNALAEPDDQGGPSDAQLGLDENDDDEYYGIRS